MKTERFELRAYHFHKLTIELYDNLKDEELYLSIYELINLLNDVTRKEYDLMKAKKELTEILEHIMSKLEEIDI